MRRLPRTSVALIALACVLSFSTWVIAGPVAQQTDAAAWVIWETDAPIQRLALRDGALWAGAYNGGLIRWDPQTGPKTTFSAPHGLTGADVLSVAVDASGATWVALFDGGVARISANGQVSAMTPTQIGSARPWDLAVNGSEVWLATLGGGVARYQSNGSWTTYTKAHDNLPADDVYAVAIAPDGTPWIGTIDYGVAVRDGNSWTHYTLPVSMTHPLSSTLHITNNAVTDIAIDLAGNKWFATDGSGVVVLDSTNTQWTVYNTHNSGLKSDFVQRVVIDSQGTAWFGTLGGGVTRLSADRATWSVLDTTSSRLTEDDILDLAVDGTGGLWLASYDAGLSYYGLLPATPPTFDLNPRGLPASGSGRLKGYALWLDPQTYTWTLAWSGDGQDHAFSGDILADGPITLGQLLQIEPGDGATVEGSRLVVNAHERDGEDLVQFTLDRSVTTLTVRLLIDGAYYPFNMRIGGSNARPGTLPFRMATPQPQAPTVALRAEQTALEGSPLFFSGQYTDTDSFTGHRIVWDFGDGASARDSLAVSHTYADNGTYNVTLTVTDQNGLSGTASQTIVVENVAPEVTLDALPYVAEEGQPVTFNGEFSDPGVNDTHTLAWDFGDGTSARDSLDVSHTYADNGIYTTTLTVTDQNGMSGTASQAIVVENVAPKVGTITAPGDPVRLNTAISASAPFTDTGVQDSHTAVWDWGDGSTSAGGVSETAGTGTVLGNHTYTSAGIYPVTVTVTDKDGATAETTYQSVVVYDPKSAAAGSGTFTSPTGASPASPEASGPATLTLGVLYLPEATVPSGATAFQFAAGSLAFNSTSSDWLVVSGARAQLQGRGTINGEGDYGFVVVVLDGPTALDGDMIRVKIWNRASGEVVYDTQIGAPDSAAPSTPVVGTITLSHS